VRDDARMATRARECEDYDAMKSRTRLDLASVLEGCAIGLGVALIVLAWLAFAAREASGPVIIASVATGVLCGSAWLIGRPWRAARIACASAFISAAIWLPRLFVVDAVFLRELVGAPSQRISTVLALDVMFVTALLGGVVIVGVLWPLADTIRASMKGHIGAGPRIRAHALALGLLSLAAGLALSPAYPWINHTLMHEARERLVERIQSGDMALQERPGSLLLEAIPGTAFPRLACCGGSALVAADRRFVLFVMADQPGARWGFLYALNDAGVPSAFITRARLGPGWRLVRIDWTRSPPD
jgi:hypothetical protein